MAPWSPIGYPAPPTTWQTKAQTDLTLTAVFVVLELASHISWTVLATDNLMFANHPSLVMPIYVALFGAALKAFCTDYPLNGHLNFAVIIVGYVVMHVVENLTKKQPLWDEPLSHHIHVLNMIIVVIKFVLDLPTSWCRTIFGNAMRNFIKSRSASHEGLAVLLHIILDAAGELFEYGRELLAQRLNRVIESCQRDAFPLSINAERVLCLKFEMCTLAKLGQISFSEIKLWPCFRHWQANN